MILPLNISPDSPFTIHNIPFGIISTKDNERRRCASAIDNYAIDLMKYAESGHLDHLQDSLEIKLALGQSVLNEFASLSWSTRLACRQQIIADIKEVNIPDYCFVRLSEVIMHLPMQIGGFTDYYCSLEHCHNCSQSLGPVPTIPTNWFYAPTAYNSRVSSVVPSPKSIRRPRGVFYKTGSHQEPIYAPSEEIDFELEMGFYISKPIPFGETLDIANSKDHIFGFVLLNDWSARDLQMFEMKPLGPFHGKGFGTSVSNWIVTMDALEPFSCSPKTVQDPLPFDHLRWKEDTTGALNVRLQVTLIRNERHYHLAKSNLRYLYWTPYQQLAHHASAMCGLGTGDLIGTGTISGNATDDNGEKLELGCLYEATEAGSKIISLADGENLQYLEDNDEIVLEAWCEDSNGNRALGFGDCKGKILAA